MITTDTTPSNSKFTTTLNFAAPTTTEGGKYKCDFTLDDGSGSFSSDRDLIVRIVTVSPTGPIEQYSDKDIDFKCSLDQSDNSVSSENSLSGPSIDPITGVKDDSSFVYNVDNPTTGQYECLFTFDDGQSPNGIFEVAVNIIDMVEEIMYTTYGESVEATLTCEVVSTNQVQLTFVGFDSSNTHVTNHVDGKTKTEYTLPVNVYAADRTFHCQVGEEISPGTTTLKVLQMEEQLQEKIRGNYGEEVSLTCTTDWTEGIQHPTITWYSKETADGDRIRVFVPQAIQTPDSLQGYYKSVLTLLLRNSIDNNIYECDVQYQADVLGGVIYQSTTQVILNG